MSVPLKVKTALLAPPGFRRSVFYEWLENAMAGSGFPQAPTDKTASYTVTSLTKPPATASGTGGFAAAMGVSTAPVSPVVVTVRETTLSRPSRLKSLFSFGGGSAVPVSRLAQVELTDHLAADTQAVILVCDSRRNALAAGEAVRTYMTQLTAADWTGPDRVAIVMFGAERSYASAEQLRASMDPQDSEAGAIANDLEDPLRMLQRWAANDSLARALVQSLWLRGKPTMVLPVSACGFVDGEVNWMAHLFADAADQMEVFAGALYRLDGRPGLLSRSKTAAAAVEPWFRERWHPVHLGDMFPYVAFDATHLGFATPVKVLQVAR